MAHTNIYLNFQGETEAAFSFYQSIFGGEFIGGISRFSDIPAEDGCPAGTENMVMHVQLEILGGHILMGSDMPESMGKLIKGNNFSIALAPDKKAATDSLFAALSAGGQITMPLQDMFWGAYYGSCIDKFGIQWMFNCTEAK